MPLKTFPHTRLLHLRVEDKRRTDLVSGGTGLSVVEALGVETQTERDLDARAQSLGVTEAQDTRVVDLGLDERGVVEVGLGADLEVDLTGRAAGVVDGLGTSLDVLGDLVVVRSRVSRKVTQGVQGDGVVWGRVTDGGRVTGDGTSEDVVGGLTTDEEALTTDDGVGGESGALREKRKKSARVH